MLVNLEDGVCRSQIVVTDADDATMTVDCTLCGDSYSVEPDAFNDGGVVYWPAAMGHNRGGGGDE